MSQSQHQPVVIVFHVEQNLTSLLAFFLHLEAKSFEVLLNMNLLRVNLHVGNRALLLLDILVNGSRPLQHVLNSHGLTLILQQARRNHGVESDWARLLLPKVQLLTQ